MSTTASATRPNSPDNFIEHARREVDSGGSLCLSAGDESLELDSATARLLLTLMMHTQRGQRIEINPLPAQLTTGQAADLLGVSRPTVVSLVDNGTLPATRIGSHRRLRTEDVIAYRDQARRERSKAMGELTQLSQELGLYD